MRSKYSRLVGCYMTTVAAVLCTSVAVTVPVHAESGLVKQLPNSTSYDAAVEIPSKCLKGVVKGINFDFNNPAHNGGTNDTTGGTSDGTTITGNDNNNANTTNGAHASDGKSDSGNKTNTSSDTESNDDDDNGSISLPAVGYNSDTAGALSKAFNYGVTPNSMAKAKKITRPAAGIAQLVMSIILIGVIVLYGATTVLDFVCFTVPCLRKNLIGSRGIGGRQLVSDEAVAALKEAGIAAPMNSNDGMGGDRFGGDRFGGDHFGSGFGSSFGDRFGGMGGDSRRQDMGNQKHIKSALLTYVKKRAFSMFILALAIVLLLSNIFFNFGTTLANAFLGMFVGK